MLLWFDCLEYFLEKGISSCIPIRVKRIFGAESLTFPVGSPIGGLSDYIIDNYYCEKR